MILKTLSAKELQLQKLIEIYRRAEIQIEKELTRKRALDLVDFAERAALKRVQQTLAEMTQQAEEQAPIAIESFFDTTAESLTTTKTDVVNTLVNNYMGKIDEAAEATFESAKEYLAIGRLAADEFRTLSLERVAESTAIGKGWRDAQRKMAIDLNNKGITAFTDKAGRQWDLTGYCSMLTRTTARQAQVAATLTENDHDLWQILPHGTTCALCAAYQGRVYSKSGLDPDYPPLSSAFGKIDPLGSNDLTNTYLNIHPNCLVPGGLVLCEGVVSESRRLYRGEVVTFKTSRGDEITVTPNHPILTDRGFIAAGLLKKGDKVIQTTGKYASLIRQTPNNIHVPTAVDKIFHTLMQTGGGSSLTVKSTAEQFHGDGIPDSEVDIIFSNSLGKRKINALLSEEVGKHNFPTARLGRFALFTNGALAKIVKRTLFARYSRVTRPCSVGGVERVPENLKKFSDSKKTTTTDFGNFGKCLALVMKCKKTLKLRAVRFLVRLRNNAVRFTSGSARRTKPENLFGTFDIAHRYPEFFGYLSSGEPLLKKRLERLWVKNGIVESVVSHVSTSVYDGYVYNFETKYGFYTYNSIVTHNCLCTLAPYTTAGKTDEEIQKDKEFSSFEKRPANVDYRTEQQRDEYRAKEKARAEYRNTKKQFEKYKAAGVPEMPIRLTTFEKHKLANDDKYKEWERLFRQINRQDKEAIEELL